MARSSQAACQSFLTVRRFGRVAARRSTALRLMRTARPSRGRAAAGVALVGEGFGAMSAVAYRSTTVTLRVCSGPPRPSTTFTVCPGVSPRRIPEKPCRSGDVLAVDLQQHVALLDAGLLGGRAGRHARDLHAGAREREVGHGAEAHAAALAGPRSAPGAAAGGAPAAAAAGAPFIDAIVFVSGCSRSPR